MVRAIKAMQSIIRPEQYNQSNTISNTVRAIKMIWLTIRLGQTQGWLHYRYYLHKDQRQKKKLDIGK